jgi:hypothetical protein
MRKRHLAPAHVAVARRSERETVGTEPLVDETNEKIAQRLTLAAQRRTSTPSKASSAASGASSDIIGGVPHWSRSMPGAEGVRERERLRVPEPTRERCQ